MAEHTDCNIFIGHTLILNKTYHSVAMSLWLGGESWHMFAVIRSGSQAQHHIQYRPSIFHSNNVNQLTARCDKKIGIMG